MSSRALRKAAGGPTIETNAVQAEQNEAEKHLKSDDDEEDEAGKNQPKKPNIFSLLALEDFEVEDDEVSNEVSPTKPASNTTSVAENSKKKKKKKKREKKNEEEFDLDKYAQDVAEERKRREEAMEETVAASLGPGHDRSVLSIDYRLLDPDFEMTRIFGSGVMRQQGVRRVAVRSRGTALIRPKANWPAPAQVGLSMRHAETTNDGDSWFVVEHSKDYRKHQDRFYLAVQSYNPDNLQEIMRQQPYHVDTLLQLSEVFKMQEDYDVAADLVERALFAFSRSVHPLFNIAGGHCRLDYRVDVNRAFFLSIFHHISFLSRRGCNRTALEFCKILLSLNPKSDPLAAILMIDHYCIMTGEYEFLLRLYELWQTFKNLNQLPNFVFSSALAHWRRSRRDSGDEGKADSMLQDGLLRFPGWLPIMLDKCSVAPDARVSRAAFFHKDSASLGLQQLYKLHAGRCFHAWKDPETVHWLERNVAVVLDIVERGSDPRIAEYKEHRQRRYAKTPVNVLRHIILAAIPDVPVDLSTSHHGEITLYDPLPPSDGIVSYQRQSMPRRVEHESGVFSALLRSLLPNYDPDAPPPPQGAAPNNVAALLDGIRDLLAGLQPAPPPVENREDGEDVEEDVEEVD